MSDVTPTTERALENEPKLEMDPGYLVISGDQPVTIHIKATPRHKPTIAGFSTDPHSNHYYTGGIKWQLNEEYAKFVTFDIPENVSYVDCPGLPYAPVVNHKQQMCILSVAQSYGFFVYYPDGTRHDPEIIVTPPNLPGPSCG